jgi:TatD DNase family protein
VYDPIVLVDTHCHLDVAAFDDDRRAAIDRARAARVEAILVPAIRPATWASLRSDPMIAVAIGIHPQIVPALDGAERDADLAAGCVTHGAIAVGECGLDGGTPDASLQERVFRRHIAVARELRLPLVVHVLRAHDVAPRILTEEKADTVGGVLHSYSGGAALVPIYAELGFAFSFAGPVTYANARRPIEAARAVPDHLLLAETDAPDQAPVPHRGGRSEPAFVREVIAGLAAIRGVTFEAMAALTTANAHRIFRLPLLATL